MLTNAGAAFLLYAFAFLEKQPVFKCQLNYPSTEWTYGTSSNNLDEYYCSSNPVYNCEVDWKNPESLHNLME